MALGLHRLSGYEESRSTDIDVFTDHCGLTELLYPDSWAEAQLDQMNHPSSSARATSTSPRGR